VDFAYVGAAAVGCVLANRRSEDPDSQVLLLGYGGGDTNLVLYVPLGFYFTSRSLASGAASPASRSPPGREGRGEQGQAERDDDRSRGLLYGTERDPGAAVRGAGRRGGSELEQAQRVGVAAAESVTERGGGDHARGETGALSSDGPLQRADGSAQVTVDRRQRRNHYYERVEVTMKYERGGHDSERVAVLSRSADCASRQCRACHTHPAASSTRPALRADRSERRPGSLASGQPPRRLPPRRAAWPRSTAASLIRLDQPSQARACAADQGIHPHAGHTASHVADAAAPTGCTGGDVRGGHAGPCR
jgi:hypothetical protein